MKIYINDRYAATADVPILGYMGEHNARTIDITQPTVEGAESYILRFEYPDGIIYDVPIEDGKVKITASLLCVADDVRCQWIAKKPNSEGSYDIVAKSQIFTLTVKPSIGDDIAPIPTYEQAQSMLDELENGIKRKITEPEQDGTSGQVLATDGNGGRYWRTVQGGGSGGENGATFTPSVSDEGIISWTNDKGLPNPEPVNIKGVQGEQGADGIGITNATINSSNELVLTYSNGQIADLGVVVGADGKDGKDGSDGSSGSDGVSITNTVINGNGDLIITLSSGATINAGHAVGADGQSGSDGADGISITGATVNSSGDLVLSLSNSTTVNAGHVVGANGADGDDYVLTENDKSEIADIAIGNLADGDERRYPQ